MLRYASARELSPLALVTTVYIALLYCFFFAQSYVKIWLIQNARGSANRLKSSDVRYCDPVVAKIKYDVASGSIAALVADRAVGNTLEQAIPFLVASWLHAVFVPAGAALSAKLAYMYILSRFIYPLCFYCGHPYLLLSTVPGYLIIFYQLLTVAVAATEGLRVED